MKKLGIILSATILMACQGEQKGDNTKDSVTTSMQVLSDSLTFHYDSVKVYSTHPVSKDVRVTDTAKAMISYPVFSDPQLNKFIKEGALKSDDPEKSYSNYQEYATDFIKGFDDFQEQNQDRIQTWFLDIRTEVIRQDTGYLAMIRKYVNYSGGAHPNTVHVYLNYDPVNHQEMTLDSLLLPGARAKLNEIAEGIFRRMENLKPTESLKDKYFFENDKFKLNDNFTITKEGLKFLYNPYEIKAYVYGITNLTIPYSELNGIARPVLLSKIN
jgi:hypothetical protein